MLLQCWIWAVQKKRQPGKLGCPEDGTNLSSDRIINSAPETLNDSNEEPLKESVVVCTVEYYTPPLVPHVSTKSDQLPDESLYAKHVWCFLDERVHVMRIKILKGKAKKKFFPFFFPLIDDKTKWGSVRSQKGELHGGPVLPLCTASFPTVQMSQHAS